MHPYVSVDFICWRTWKILRSYLPENLQYSSKFWDTFTVREMENDSGEQAFVGELFKKDRPSIRCIYKASKYENSLVAHEYRVMRALNRALQWFPYIPRVYGLVKYPSRIDSEKGLVLGDTFTKRSLLLIESINGLESLDKFVCRRSFEKIVAVFKQLLICIRVFRSIQFTHYDLHTENILICKCPDDLVIKYRIGGKEFIVKTHGYMPVIIDFGFSYIDNKEGDSEPLYADLTSAKYGYLCDRFMPFTDYIRLFHSIGYDLRNTLNADKRNFRKVLKKVFSKCSAIIPNNGWESALDDTDYLDEIMYIVEEINLKIFKHNTWVHTLQLLIPQKSARKKDSPNNSPFFSFACEWSKIEERINSMATLNYLFKYLVTLARARENVSEIKHLFLEEFAVHVNSFIPSEVDYEKLIETVRAMAEIVSVRLFHYLNEREAEMLGSYEKLPFTHETIDDYLWKKLDQLYPQKIIETEFFIIEEPKSENTFTRQYHIIQSS